MKGKYRLVAGDGLPLAGLSGLVDSRPSKSREGGLLPSPLVIGVIAAIASLAAAVFVLRRADNKPEEESSSTDVLGSAPPSAEASSENASVERGLLSGMKDLFSKAVESLGSTPDSKPIESKPSSASRSPEPTPRKIVDAVSAQKKESDLLSKGKYTAEEVEHIRRISQSGNLTGATVGRQMPPQVRDEVIAAANRHGLDPEQMLRVASLESGGNPDAVSATGAVGVFQFTSGTASDFGLVNRFDYKANIEAGMLLTKRSQASLKKAGLGKKAESSIAIYIAHQIGAQGAKEVLSKTPGTKISRLSKGTQKNIRVNIGGSSNTVGEYLQANQAALKRTYDQQVASDKPAVQVSGSSRSTETAPTVSQSTTARPSKVASQSAPPPVGSTPSSGGSGAAKTASAPAQPAASSSTPPAPETKVAKASTPELDPKFSPKSAPQQKDQVPENVAQSDGIGSIESPNNGTDGSPQSVVKLKNGMMVKYG